MRVPQRGRAILRRLSAHEPVRAFRPGDFLLTSSGGGLARLTGWATGERLNHAAVIIDPLGTVVEANPTLASDPRAFRLATVADYLNRGKPCWIGYVELREGSRQDVAGYAGHLLRARVASGLSGQLWLALHTTLGIAPRAWCARARWLAPLGAYLDRHALVIRAEHCFSAAELVARSLERGGFIWDRDPAYVTPADLFHRFHHIDDLPAPVEIDRRRRAPAPQQRAQPRESRESRESQAAITPFARRGVRGATALSAAPQAAEAPRAGVWALAQVGVFMAAGLALVGIVEEAIKLLAREA